MNQGMLLESLNLAAVWHLPVLFVCKGDGWAITTQSASMTGGDLNERARGLGVPAIEVDGLDVSEVWEAARAAIERARSGKGPTFLHARCVSWPFSHPPEWNWIREATIQGRPIVGNGGIFTPSDALGMVNQTDCDGVMVARGMLGNPWIFHQIRDLAETGSVPPVSFEERAGTMAKHLALSVATFGEKQGILRMRKHLSWYVKGLPLASDFRGRINVLRSRGEIEEEIRKYFTKLRRGEAPGEPGKP